MHVGALLLEIHLPGCASLKEKRSRLKPLLARLQREFNLSCAEVGANDQHRISQVACVVVSNDSGLVQSMLEGVLRWIERNRPDMQVIDHHISLL